MSRLRKKKQARGARTRRGAILPDLTQTKPNLHLHGDEEDEKRNEPISAIVGCGDTYCRFHQSELHAPREKEKEKEKEVGGVSQKQRGSRDIPSAVFIAAAAASASYGMHCAERDRESDREGAFFQEEEEGGGGVKRGFFKF